MATLTISSTYTVSPDPVEVPLGGKLDIVVPSGGVLICLESDLAGQGKYKLTADKTIDLLDLTDAPIGSDVFAPDTADCPNRAKRNAHSIKIGSGMPG